MKDLKFIAFLFFVVLFAGCQNQLQDIGKEVKQNTLQEQANVFAISAADAGIRLVNGRLVFANLDVYNKTVNEVLKMSQKQVEIWEKSLGFSSLRAYNVSHIQNQRLADIPPCYTTLLNTKGEYQIGTLIYWMNTDGYTYFITDGDEKQLAKVQANPKNASVKRFPYSIQNIPFKGQTNGGISAFATIPGNGIDARYQYQYGSGGITYKMVFEVFSYAQPALGIGGWGYSNELWTAVKLEYRQNNGNWAAAGETSTKTILGSSYMITCNGTTLSGGYFGGSQTTGGQGFYYKFNQTPIFSSGVAATWSVYINGNYYENVPVHSQTYNVNPAIW